MPGQTSTRSSLRVATVIPAAAAALFSLACVVFRPDDLYIYMRVVDNVTQGRGWGFNAFEPVNVASSGSWLMILIGLSLTFGTSVLVAQAASAFFTMAGIAGAACLAGKLANDDRAAWAAGLALATDAWVGRWIWSGMETGFAMALACWMLALRLNGAARVSNRRLALSSAMLALLPVTRPELVVIPLVVLLVNALSWRKDGKRRIAYDVVALAVVGASWVAFSLTTWGALLPATAHAKGSLGAGNIAMFDAIGRIAMVLGSTQVLWAFGALFALPWFLMRRDTGSGRRSITIDRADAARIILGSATLLTALYGVRHVRIYTRYLMPLTALIVALGCAAFVHWCLKQRKAWHSAWLIALVLTIGWNAMFSMTTVVPKTREYAASMDEVVIPLSIRLDETLDSDAVIAVPNIGAIGYITGRRILDLNGLATPEIVEHKRKGTIPEYLAQSPPDVLIEIEPERGAWPERVPSLQLDEVATYEFYGMFVRGPEPMYVTVYEVSPLDPSRSTVKRRGVPLAERFGQRPRSQ